MTCYVKDHPSKNSPFRSCYYVETRNKKQEADEQFYGYSYMAPDPKTWAEQQIGFTIVTVLSNHILTAYHQVKVTPISECNCQEPGEI